jgi:PAS domain S-box-containing protein
MLRVPVMNSPILTRRLAAMLIAVFVGLEASFGQGVSADTLRTRNVLILHSYSSRIPYTAAQDTAIRETLARQLRSPVAFFTFELDAPSVENEERAWESVRSFLLTRYAGREIDLIVCTDTPAARFLSHHGEAIFPGVPVVCSAPTEIPEVVAGGSPRMTGVVESLAIGRTLELIRYFHPDARHVWAITTPGSYGQRLRAETEEALRTLVSPPEVEWLPLLDRERMASLLAGAPPDAAVLWLNYWDPTGEYATLEETLGVFSTTCPRPIYALYDTYLGLGVVGGYMASAEAYGRTAGAMAARILDGEPIESLPPIFSANPIMLDARQLERFRIDGSRLPAGSLVRFVEPTFLQRNGRIVAVAAAVVVTQGLIIGWLVISRRRLKRSEEARRDSEARFRALTENIPGIIYRARNTPDGHRHLDYASKGLEQVLGPRLAAQLRANFDFYFTLMSPEDYGAIQEAADRSLRDRAPFHCLYRVRTEWGDLRWIRSIATHLVLADGTVQWDGVLLDATSEQRAQQGLKESEARYRALVEALPVGVCVHDGERLLYINEAFARTLGAAAPRELRALMVADMIHPDNAAACAARSAFVLDQRLPVEAKEVRLIRLDGSVVDVEIRCTPVTLGGRQAVHTTVVDLTERREAEHALRSSEEKLRQITENAHEVFWLSEVKTRGLGYVSPAFEQVWGIPVAEALRDPEVFFRSIHPEDRARVETVARDSVLEFDHEYRIVRPDGQVRWIRDRAFPVRDASGLVVRIAGVAHDVTESRQARESLERTSKVQQMLLSELDHRVKNSLSGLLTLIELTRHGAASISDFADSIRARVRAMATVHAILSDAHWAPVPLRRLVTALIPPGLPGAFRVEGPLVAVPAHQVTALAMIIQELMTNSVKHGAAGAASGTVTIEWSVANPGEADGPELVMRWSERGGPPMSASVKPGTGLRLVEGFCRFELAGSCRFEFGVDGARHEIRAALNPHAEPLRPIAAETGHSLELSRGSAR